MWKSTKQIFKISLLMIILMLHSCIVVKEQVSDESDVEELAVLSIKPEIPMSDVILRSNKGDMVSYIPEGWFFIDTEQRSSSDIIAVIANPEYSLCAVFSNLNFTGISIEKKDNENNVETLFDVAPPDHLFQASLCLKKLHHIAPR